MVVRAAGVADLEPVLAIAGQRRHQYASYQPQFWNPAADALNKQRAHLAMLLNDREALFTVVATPHQVQGFLIAKLVPAPPVYDPGGATCVVDDFAVSDAESWSDAGPLLLGRVRSWAAERGAVQLVVVTAGADNPKRAASSTANLSLASEWWVGAIK